MMDQRSDLCCLRGKLLLHPEDCGLWQDLIDLIEALGGGFLLSELDELFEQPIAEVRSPIDRERDQLLEQGLESHRSGDAVGLRQALVSLQRLEHDGAWTHALQGLLAEMDGVSAYGPFVRALERDPANGWFRYWASVAALRRRDWIDFAWLALLLNQSETLEHQLVVLAGIYHLMAAALVQLSQELCLANDLRVLDLLHPDMIPHDREGAAFMLLRSVDKERRKMLRILLSYLQQSGGQIGELWMQIHWLQELLRWRICGLSEPLMSAEIYAALQRQLEAMPDRCWQYGCLHNILPHRPGLVFGEEHLRVLQDFKLVLVFSP
jgi:hypothetical protein